MAKPQPADPVKLIVAVLWSRADDLERALAGMRQIWGDIDYAGPDHAFDLTNYYEPEMGGGIKRRIVSFTSLVASESIRQAKLACNELEEQLSGGHGRGVNLDIGYLDHNKIVLASAKHAGQKIHLGDGIYADLVGRYRDGRYQPFEWTFPDFRDGRYDVELGEIRKVYLMQLRELKRK